MADTVGPQPLVSVVPNLGSGAKAGDALLDVLGGFLQAVLNAEAASIWTAAGVAASGSAPAGREVAIRVFTSDPEQPGTEFQDRELPALFLWRSAFETPVWWGQGWRVRKSTVELAWVFPPAAMAAQTARDPFVNVLQAVVDEQLEFMGRNPAYVYPGDTDPDAATRGSDIWPFLNVVQLYLERVQKKPLVIRAAAGAPGFAPRTYFRVQALLTALERVEQDPAAWFDPEDGLDMATSIAPDAPAGALPFLDPLLYRGPKIVSVSPATGPAAGGTLVTVTSDEDTFRAGAVAEIGGVEVATTVVDTKTITFTTPAVGAGAADVTVTNPNGSSDTLADAFTFL